MKRNQFVSFKDYLDDRGITEEEYRARSEDESDLIPQPPDDPISIEPSKIEGRGTIVKADIPKGERIALALDPEYHRTPAARYLNHSGYPNTLLRKMPDGIHLIARRGIQADEELTLDYSDMLGEQKTAAENQEWVGVDLDGTLARYDGWEGPDVIGRPLPQMVKKVLSLIGRGTNVKIFTARVAGDNDGRARRAVKKWCREHLGVELPITCIKDQHCREIWDDRAKKVYKNRGVFKRASGDMCEYFQKQPKKLKERQQRQKDKRPMKKKQVQKAAALLLSLKEARLKIEGRPVQPKSPEQAEAGNYRKAHTRLHGMDIAVENLKGQYRRGTSSDGTEWKSLMKHHYGYIKKTRSGADGDHVDVFIGPDTDSEVVFVINQVKPGTKTFDEHKCMLGFTNEAAARKGYLGNYEKGWTGLGSVTPMTIDQFKWWVKNGNTSKPAKARLQKSAQHLENVKSIGPLTPDELQRGLRDAIIAEQDAVKQYETIVESTSDQRVKKVLQSISNEEKVHVGELDRLIADLDHEDSELRREGEQEVEEMNKESSEILNTSSVSWLVPRVLELIGKR